MTENEWRHAPHWEKPASVNRVESSECIHAEYCLRREICLDTKVVTFAPLLDTILTFVKVLCTKLAWYERRHTALTVDVLPSTK